MSEQFEKWLQGYDPALWAAYKRRIPAAQTEVRDRRATWNAALASRATGEMPERPKRTETFGGGCYRPMETESYFDALEAQIAELRAQVEDKSKPGRISFVSEGYLAELVAKNQELRAALATAEDCYIRKALAVVEALRLHEHALYVSDEIYKITAIENEDNVPYSRAVRDAESAIRALLPSAESASKETK